MWLQVDLCTCECQCLWDLDEGIAFPGARVTLQAVVNCLTWMLGIELRLSERQVLALNN